jgi:hypothetical protein
LIVSPGDAAVSAAEIVVYPGLAQLVSEPTGWVFDTHRVTAVVATRGAAARFAVWRVPRWVPTPKGETCSLLTCGALPVTAAPAAGAAARPAPAAQASTLAAAAATTLTHDLAQRVLIAFPSKTDSLCPLTRSWTLANGEMATSWTKPEHAAH